MTPPRQPRYTVEVFSWGAEPATAAAIALRFAVFVEEQRVPAHEELDATDAVATHVLVRTTTIGDAVATGRVYWHQHGTVARIGRMAVALPHRGQGAGRAAMEAMMVVARGWHAQRVILDAQDHAIPFYERFGFRVAGPPHLDCGIPHHLMEAILPQDGVGPD